MKNGFLTGNALKIIAMLSMLIDHTGMILLDNYEPFRIIGRLAYPLYAFLITEGTKHTKNKLFYFLRVFSLGILCQAVYYYTYHSLYLNILLTFSVSIPMIYLLDHARKNGFFTILFIAATSALWSQCQSLSAIGINFDYGFLGILFPVLLSISNNRREKSILAFFGLFLLSQNMGGHQIWSLLSIIPILTYNGKRGIYNMKTFFYLFYPIHLAVLYGANYLLKLLR